MQKRQQTNAYAFPGSHEAIAYADQ
jgi:hypothetical protein